MFKILSKDRLAELQLYQEPSDRSLGYEENIAQAQMEADARALLSGKVTVIVPGKLLDITVTVTPEEYDSLKKLAQVAD
jgi:hypothetical protein